jgi:2-dehydropantoate 2-reductase
MRLLIYGAGALGQALACMLAADGHQVDMILRPRFIDAIKHTGLAVRGIFGDFHVTADRLGLFASMAECAGRHYDMILVSTKTYDLDAAIRDIADLPDQSCPVVSMHNGCGNLEKLAEQFGPERSLAARIITGFTIEQPGIVRITVSADAIHLGGTIPGSIPPAAHQLAVALQRAGHPCVAVADVRQSLYAKLLYNCALNPLGGILGVPYGALAAHGETQRIMDKIIEESFAVIHAFGGSMPWPDATSYRAVFYNTLVPASAEHRASMLSDLEQHKPTEVDAMVGYIAAQGRKYGVATPYSDCLAALVRFKEGRGATG